MARGWVHARALEWPEAERAFREAIRLNPKLTAAYTSLAIPTLQPLGDPPDDADRLLREAGRSGPARPERAADVGPGSAGTPTGRPKRSTVLEPLEPARNTDANFLLVDVFLGRALVQVGRATEALPLLERHRQRLVYIRLQRPTPGRRGRYAALARRADAEALAATNDHLPFRRAIINGAPRAGRAHVPRSRGNRRARAAAPAAATPRT